MSHLVSFCTATNLQACFSSLQLRQHLRASLRLLMTLPRSFIKEIADRMACGLSIILRGKFPFFEEHEEWTFIGDILDMLAGQASSRTLIFDGIASTVEYSIPNSEGPTDMGRPQLSEEACSSLSRILTRFVLGFYEEDFTLSVPAMLCLEKLYQRQVELLQKTGPKEEGCEVAVQTKSLVPDKELWQNLVVAVYSVCRSTNDDASGHGVECFQRVMSLSPVDQVPMGKWLAVMYLVVMRQPPISADVSRANTFIALGRLLIRALPVLSHEKDFRDDLMDIVEYTAALARENLLQGRQGNVSQIFEKTLQTVTYLANHMVTDEWGGEKMFSEWASETLLTELEGVGTAGASLKNQAAVRKPPLSVFNRVTPMEQKTGGS
jgi:hypothetical protein